MSIIVTGAAGFIGYHLCEQLLARGEHVIGLDTLNDYYSVALKRGRLAQLEKKPNFTFKLADISDEAALSALPRENKDISHIINLAAQAGVRHSITHPSDYVKTNLDGFLGVLELARRLPNLRLLVYASSSSVYGANTKLPFSVEDRVDTPVSLYGATKKANEVMAYSYSHLYKIPAIGLRFFTVYGPWGRPDMAYFTFTRAILAGEPINVFNHGKMRRDFTYIDDIVAGMLSCLGKSASDLGIVPHRLYNLGNHRSEELMKFIRLLEEQCGRPANIVFGPMQKGDVLETYADIEATSRDLDFHPKTPIELGIPRFVRWYRQYYCA